MTTQETRPRHRRLVHARRRRARAARHALQERAARSSSRARAASAATRAARGQRVRGGAARRAAGSSGPSPTTATRRRRRTSSTDPFEPYAIAAVELDAREDGRARAGRAGRRRRATSRSGMEMELVLDTLYEDARERVRGLEVEARGGVDERGSRDPRRRHAPLGQVGAELRRVRRERGARRARRRRPRVDATSSSSPAATRCATAIPATSRARRFAQALGWNGAQVGEHLRRLRHRRAGDRASRARTSSRGSATSRSWSAPTPRRRASSRRPAAASAATDPDWLRFRLLGATNPIYFGLYARRRMELFGATERDFAQVKVKNSRHGLDEPERALQEALHEGGGAGVADRLRPAAAARHLRDQRRRRGARAHEHGVRAQARREAGARSRRSRR